jgi:glycosyltransferase A (GT-A) superfamily protein (DUF2064 family)
MPRSPRTALLNRSWTCASRTPREDVQLVVIDDLPGRAPLQARLSPPYSPEQAGLLAKAAVADTLRAVDATPRARRAASDGPSLYLRTETPQISAALLGESAAMLRRFDAVLGPTTGDGWWAFGFREPDRAISLGVAPWSVTDLGALTLLALRLGLRVAMLPVLQEVSTPADAYAVAERCGPGSRFAAALSALQRPPAGC